MNETKQCPKCNTDNPLVANYCRHCRYEFPEVTKKGQIISPKIVLFAVCETNYTTGSIIHLKWEVENADIIYINDIDVTSVSTFELKVDKPDTITLVAENDYEKASRSLRLSPKPTPTIKSFSSSTYKIKAGQDVKLKWDVRNSAKVILSYLDTNIDVTKKDYFKLSPKQTETFKLICFADDDSVYTEQELTIHVLGLVKINSFTADKDVVVESEKVKLSWNVENATSIILRPFMRDITNANNYEVSPSRSTEYTIVAQNSISQEERTITVGVRQLPKINMDNLEFSKIEIPSCNINISSGFDEIKISRIDKYMIDRNVCTEGLYYKLSKLRQKIVHAIKKIF